LNVIVLATKEVVRVKMIYKVLGVGGFIVFLSQQLHNSNPTSRGNIQYMERCIKYDKASSSYDDSDLRFYWDSGSIDPKHNKNSNTDIEKVEEEEGKVTRPANPNLNQQQSSTTSQRCTSIQ